MFSGGLGVAFLILAALETGLEIKWCFKVTLGRHERGGGKKVGLDPHQVTLKLLLVMT